MARILTHDRMETFLRCQQRFKLEQRGVRGQISRPQRRAMAVGKAVELATTTTDINERVDIVMQQIEHLPRKEQELAAAAAVELIARADSFADDSVDSDKQVQFSWTDSKGYGATHWTLKAKPDEVQRICDDKGLLKVIRIIDDKTASRASCRHMRNLYFFGLVVSKQLQTERAVAIAGGAEQYLLPSIELVVRTLGKTDTHSPAEKSFWYSRRREAEQLQEIRRVIGMMEAAEQSGNYPAKYVAWDCPKCKFRSTCEAFISRQSEPES